MKASCSNSISFLWKSFIWGWGLLDAGSRWRIGDGSSVNFYHDLWLPRPSTFKVLSPPVLPLSTKVASLNSPSEGWNDSLVHDSFLPDDAVMILSIPWSNFQHGDSLTWQFDKMGLYSVKSGYHFRYASVSNPSSSGLNNSESWWKCLWRIKVPLKGCPLLKKIHSGLSFMKGVRVGDRSSFTDFMILCRSYLCAKEFELLCVFMWRVWFCRNGCVHNSVSLLDGDIVQWVTNFVEEFR
ncbi:hypothetical protein Dsin_027020 [Dipteronia sinensis]|uniref:Uncharacterized protein n=1 Tax=Dipteronia sinensis TaxID=43782 RepID=A0AAD9ZYQ5_9ROSI|nr:hypothetical protein Dsin_027020 [Dipteronia sinensis]